MVRSAIAVGYHEQDRSNFCGPACAQMVLSNVSGALLDQLTLAGDIQVGAMAGPWASAPDKLFTAMNGRSPNPFKLINETNLDTLSRALCWSLHTHGEPAIALVGGSAHWIVVTNYSTTNHPASETDTSYTIRSFFVHNPLPAVPGGSHEPPHTDGDNCGNGTGSRGTPNQHVTYFNWKKFIMQRGTVAGCWCDRYVAICRHDSPGVPVCGDSNVCTNSGHGSGGGGIDGRSTRDSLGVISDEEAIAAALKGFDEFELRQEPAWEIALKETDARTPLLVQHLDLPELAYFIVPFVDINDEKRFPVLANVDAREGVYLESIAQPDGTTNYTHRIDPAELERRFPEGQILPYLVWRDCLESSSTFFPFYVVEFGDRRLFVRIDGAEFDELHDAIGA
jgi:hypothetical protein